MSQRVMVCEERLPSGVRMVKAGAGETSTHPPLVPL